MTAVEMLYWQRCVCGAIPYRRGNVTTTHHRPGCAVAAADTLADAEDERVRDAEAAYDAAMNERER